MLLASIPEAVDVVLQSFAIGVNRRIHTLHALHQQAMVVDTLGPRKNLLATHVEVVRVGVALFAGGHGVKWTNG